MWAQRCLKWGVATAPLAPHLQDSERPTPQALRHHDLQAFELKLAPSERRRRAKLLLTSSWVIAAMCSLGVAGTSEISPLGRLLFVAFLVAPAAALTYYWLPLVRPAGWVSIGGGLLVVRNDGLLRRPYSLPLERIRAVSVHVGSLDAVRRFPVEPLEKWPSVHGQPRPAWLWHAGTGSRYPLFAVAEEPPNLAIVLDTPIRGADVRRERLHGPLRGEALEGLLLRVDEPIEAARCFEQAGLLRPLS
jgi:hypothetical protein